MRKKLLGAFLLGVFTIAATSTFVSCKDNDYDDDIAALQKQIASNDAALAALQTQWAQGVVITDVKKDGAGVTLTTSDGQTYTISNGAAGAAGKDATVWAIGTDGYWYQDGIKTSYKAVGTDGKDGADGKDGKDGKDGSGANGKDGKDGSDGKDGKDGANGEYYVPNTTDHYGYFDKVDANGTKTQTDIKWAQNDAISAVMGKRNVTISGVNGYADGIKIAINADLTSLVFHPDSYYWGVEATTVKTLTMPWYNVTKALDLYVKDVETSYELVGNRVEANGTSRITTENAIAAQYQNAILPTEKHERYAPGTSPATYTLTLDAKAVYHVNPTVAYFDDETEVSVLSENKKYTRAMGNATVALNGVAKGADHDWTVANGKLTVPLKVSGTVGTVNTTGADGVTVFATQVKFQNSLDEEAVVTSDYAALVQETVKDLKLAHVRFTPTKKSETGMLNKHCGACSLYGSADNGMHIFQSISEAVAYIEQTSRCDDATKKGEGWDLVKYDKDKDLNDLVETHYTNTTGAHAKFPESDFNKYFEYRFQLVSAYLGDNKTDESAHAALHVDPATGHYMLHPQDPQAGGKAGRPYDAANKATEVCVNRVPVVRVELIYKAENKVIDYGYIPVRITKEDPVVVLPTKVLDKYASTKDHEIVRFNDCITQGGSNTTLYSTNWRDTEEDLFTILSNDGETNILSREQFDGAYLMDYDAIPSTGGYCSDGQQYYITNYKDYNKNRATVKPNFTEIDNSTPVGQNKQKFGVISYTEHQDLAGSKTSTFEWKVKEAEIRSFAEAGIDTVVRAVRFQTTTGNVNAYPDIYVIFRSGKLKLTKYTVKGDAHLKDKIIKEYWYNAGTFEEGKNEIHANTITPQENENSQSNQTRNGWKPRDLDDKFSDVFANNFRTTSGADQSPRAWVTFKAYNGSTEATGVTLPPIFNNNNMQVDFIFDASNDNYKFKGKVDNSDAKDFDIRVNTAAVTFQLIDGTTKTLPAGKVLQAKRDTDPATAWQNIAWIDEWDFSTLTQLRSMEVHLNWLSNYAKALLNYKAHDEIGQPNVLKATIALVPVVKEVKEGKKIALVSGETKCPITLENNTFDVRFLRPLSLGDSNNPTIIDAHTSGTVTVQTIELAKLVTSYTDWRNAWNTTPTLDYEKYYAPENEVKLTASIESILPGELLSKNPNVTCDLLLKSNGDPESLNKIHTDLQLRLSDDGKFIEYRNNSSTVREFHIYIPVKVEYYWGTLYDKVTLTVKTTAGNGQ